MSTTLDELRAEWADHTRRLDEHLRSNARLLREDWIERQRERMEKLGPFGRFDKAVWIATMALLGFFLYRHANQPALFVTGLVLDIWVIAAGVVQLLQQQALRNLDFGLPLLELQARLESLRIARIRSFNVAFLTGQVVWWIPFVVVLFAGLFGVDLYSSPSFRTFAAWNIAGGIAVIPLAIWLGRRYGERLSRSSAARRIADSIAGRDLAAARDYLEKLRRFGDEGPAG
jgi:hypothetical protein